jgi:hydroxymethylbilane synthase
LKRHLNIGTRGSELAQFQAHAVADLLRARSGVDCEIVVIKTSGDLLAEAPLSQIGGKRLFVKEIEDALLNGAVDVAVHSSKDMPAVLPAGLAIGAVLPREDPRDALILPSVRGAVRRAAPGARLDPASGGPAGQEPMTTIDAVARRLGEAARIGTSSVRRIAQLKRVLPGATFGPVRGNLGTRLRKLDDGDFDALVLAAAGLRRLEQESRISALLPVTACVPAPGQGIIAVEIRSDDAGTREAVAKADDALAGAALVAERTVVERLGGGCQMPIGAYAATAGGVLTLTAIVLSIDGNHAVTAAQSGPLADAAAIGLRAAQELLAGGAGDILAEVERVRAGVEGLQP